MLQREDTVKKNDLKDIKSVMPFLKIVMWHAVWFENVMPFSKMLSLLWFFIMSSNGWYYTFEWLCYRGIP